MHSRRAALVIIYVVVLSALMPQGWGGRQQTGELFLGNHPSSAAAYRQNTGDMVEQLLLTCRLDAVTIKEFMRSSDFSIFKDTVGASTKFNFHARAPMKVSMQEISLEAMNTHFDCLRKQNFQLYNSRGEDNLKHEYLKSLLSLDPTLRRGLVSQPVRAIPLASATISSRTPDQRPAPAHAPDHAPFPVPHPQSDNSIPHNAPVFPSNSKKSRLIFIAVVLTVVVASILAAFCVCCYHKCCRNYSGHRQGDEKPLINFCLNDFSGSPQKPSGLGTPISTEKVGSLCFKPIPAQNVHVVSSEISSGRHPPSRVPSEVSASSNEPSDLETPISREEVGSLSFKPIPAQNVHVLSFEISSGQKPPSRVPSEVSASSTEASGLGSPISTEKVGSLSFKPLPAQNVHIAFEISSCQNLTSRVPSEVSVSSTEPLNALRDGVPATQPPPPPPPPPPVLTIPHAKKVAAPQNLPSRVPSEVPISSTEPLNAHSDGVPATQPPPPPPPLPLPAIPHAKKVAAPPPVPPPPVSNTKADSSIPHPSPLGLGCKRDSNTEIHGSKTKLKPLFWDKVPANPDGSMVWNQIKSGSFRFNEEKIESLFCYNSTDKRKSEGKRQSASNDPFTQCIQLLDPKKSQNLAIAIKALNVKIKEICDALTEGNELPTELLQTLLRMAPNSGEEMKLRLYCGDVAQLGPAEQFLKSVMAVPLAFKRMDALLFMSSLHEDALEIKKSLSSLEVACKELRSSEPFLKLLEVVLKTGNRMNDGTFRGGAQAFKLDTLLKLSDVKAADGKTTLLHFIVQEIIRSEDMRHKRKARESGSISSLTAGSLNPVDLIDDSSSEESGEYYCNPGLKFFSDLISGLENVKKAATIDSDVLRSMVANLAHSLVKTRDFLNKDMKGLEDESRFYHSLKSFIEHAEAEITHLLEEETRIRLLVKSTTDYFHGNTGKDEGLRLFVIVRDFLWILEKECKEVMELATKLPKTPKEKECKEVRELATKLQKTPKVQNGSAMLPLPDAREQLLQAIRDRRVDTSSSESSDDEGP